jgi:hypothetical protein
MHLKAETFMIVYVDVDAIRACPSQNIAQLMNTEKGEKNQSSTGG